MKTQSANGVTGILINNCDGEYVFRVYGKNYEFKDYKLQHNDLQVTIHDDDAEFYATGPDSDYDGILDHSRATLGREE